VRVAWVGGVKVELVRTGVSVVRRGTHCLAEPLPEDNYYRSLATLKSFPQQL